MITGMSLAPVLAPGTAISSLVPHVKQSRQAHHDLFGGAHVRVWMEPAGMARSITSKS